MPQVAHDVHHEIVVQLPRFVESVDLSFQDVEEPREIGVLGVPVGDGVAHGIPRSAPPESRRTAVRGLIQIKDSGCGVASWLSLTLINSSILTPGNVAVGPARQEAN